MQQLFRVLFNRPVAPQRGSVPLEENTTKVNTLPVEANTFERIEEYQAIFGKSCAVECSASTHE
jgi:hypothetical protein